MGEREAIIKALTERRRVPGLVSTPQGGASPARRPEDRTDQERVQCPDGPDPVGRLLVGYSEDLTSRRF